MKTYRMAHKGSKVVLELQSDVPRFEVVEDIAIAIVDYLLSLGRIDQVLMLLITLSVRCKTADISKSKFTPEQRAKAMNRVNELLAR